MNTPALNMPPVHASVMAMLDHTVAEFGDHEALVLEEQSLSYRELRACALGLSRLLRDQAPAGSRVATVLGNSLVAAVAPYAICAFEGVHVPLNPLYTSHELGYILQDAAPALVLVDDALADTVRPLVAAETVVIPSSQLAAMLGVWRSDIALQQASLDAGPLDPEALALMQYTGGSTGRPKGVLLTHRALNANIAQREALLPVARGIERVLCVMPLFHSYGMAMGLFLCGYAGATLVLQGSYHPQRLLQAIERHRITIFPGSPTLFTGLMACEDFAGTDWRRVHTCYSGSAALAAETLQRWEAATGSRVYEGYGQTEAGPVLSFNPVAGPCKIGSVGIAAPLTELEVVDVEYGTRVLQAGARGEIRARGPQVMKGYWQLPQETQEALRDGWLYTGDIGEFDEDGYLYIRDRKKDLVIVGGYNVYPREIEEVLYTHPAVSEAAVVGQPDAYRGEVLRAFVALREGQVASAEELIEFCRQRLAKYKIPAALDILAGLPKTAVNKIDKKPLKERVRKG